MGLMKRTERTRAKAALQAFLIDFEGRIATRKAQREAIEKSTDGGLLVHVAIEQGKA